LYSKGKLFFFSPNLNAVRITCKYLSLVSAIKENTTKWYCGLDDKNFDVNLDNILESLKKEEATNNRLEGQVKAFVEKRKQEETILWLKRKQAVLVNE
jgi:hypothetical protein